MRNFLLLLTLAIFPLFLTAQSFTFSGCVLDEAGDALPFVAITLVDDAEKTYYTDVDGCFSFDYNQLKIMLEIRYTGYKNVKIEAESGKALHVTLKASSVVNDFMTGRVRGSRRDTPVDYEEGIALEDVVITGRASSVSEVVTSSPPPSAPMMTMAEPRSMPSKKSRESKRPSGEMADEAEKPAAGQLTAGEVNDFGKWELWNDVSQEDLAAYRDVWGFYPDHRFAVQLTHSDGSPAINVAVQLMSEGRKVIWNARTDNHGRAELWRHIFSKDQDSQARLSLRAMVDGRTYDLPTAHTIQEGINSFALPVGCQNQTAVDIAFVVDATGSMGDEIRYLSSELQDVMRRAADSLSGQDLRLASVFYRDHGDSYLTRQIDFSAGQDSVIQFVGQQSASGGGDTPEAVDDALGMAMSKLKWRKEAAARLLFLVLDAPPHSSEEHVKRMQQITEKAARLGVRIIPVVCSGMEQSGEYLLRSMALATNGTYTFLTDHSGIGGKHLEPSTDSYTVEKLNDLLVRVIHQFGKVAPCAAAEVIAFPTRITPAETATGWTVFPNPTAGTTNLKFDNPGGDVYLLDVNGKILRRYFVNQKQQRIELGDLPSGTYFLRHELEGEVTTRRVLVNRA